jgi:hypothetical protein
MSFRLFKTLHEFESSELIRNLNVGMILGWPPIFISSGYDLNFVEAMLRTRDHYKIPCAI